MKTHFTPTRVTQITLLAVLAFSTGCRLFPQRGVYISHHKPQDGMLQVFSAPAELRMNTLIYRPDTSDPIMYNAYSNLVHQLGAAQIALAEANANRDQVLRDQAQSRINDYTKSINNIAPFVMKPLVLAEPPPEAVVTLSDLQLSASGEGGVSATPAKGSGLFGLKSAAVEIGANRNSDKRQMLYRLNEAAINFPEVRAHYQEMFIAVVNAPTSTNEVPKVAGSTNRLNSITTITPVNGSFLVTNAVAVSLETNGLFSVSTNFVAGFTNSILLTNEFKMPKQ